MDSESHQIAAEEPDLGTKLCTHCLQRRPQSDFLRRTGKRAGKSARRGTCKDCRKRKRDAGPFSSSDFAKPRTRRPLPELPPKPEGPHESVLKPNRQGIIRMRGLTDKGRRWQQETDLETAVTLVRECAAVIVGPHTIRRIYSNKSFRQYILKRDRNVCYFCGGYGDTIDHLLPRAKGGHTTPVNCVCACSLCNQSKAARSLDEFMDGLEG